MRLRLAALRDCGLSQLAYILISSSICGSLLYTLASLPLAPCAIKACKRPRSFSRLHDQLSSIILVKF
jgi:hypothetical protein